MEIIDYLLARKKAGGGSDVTIEQLSVTENGTYSEQGIAYSPVVVNVPTPENSYQLKDVPSGTVSTIDDGTALPMPSLKVGIEPAQDLNGYDHPWAEGAGKNKINLADITTPSAGFVYNREPVNLAVNTYTLSFNFTGSSGSISISLRNGETVVSTLQDQPLVNGLNTFTMPTLSNNADSISLYAGIGGTYKNFMLEVGSQATTYEPYSNICPISGWTAANVNVVGTNIWDEEWEVGDIDAQGNPTSSTTLIRTKNFNPCKPNTTYKVVIPSSASMYMKYYDKDKNFITPTVIAGNIITTPPNCYYFKFVIGSAYGATYNNDISINYPATDTSYHAHNGQTYTIEFKDGDNPLTVYGGTLNVTTGELVVDRAYVTLNGSENWLLYQDLPSGINQLYINIDNIKPSYDVITTMCNRYKSILIINRNNNYNSCYSGSSGICFNIKNTTVDEWKTSLQANNVQVAYTLAEPITYHLTPTQIRTLVGNNNIWADTGDIIEGKYFKSLT